MRLVYAGGGAVDDARSADPVEAAARALRDGAIVAIKGLGGFHLACLAADEDAVAELRARKHREDKPFALMARDAAAARDLVAMSAAERGAAAVARAPDRAGAAARRARAVAPSVAPRRAGARRDAAVLAAPPSAAGRRRASRS